MSANSGQDRRRRQFIVITPTLGTSPYLAESVASVGSQAVSPRHILVCPPAKQAELRERFPELEVVGEQSRAGLYGAINEALAAAGEWDWFTYINDDDLLRPAFSSMVVKHCEDDDDSIGFGDVRYIDRAGRSLGMIPTERDHRHFATLFRENIPPLTQQGTIVPRGVYDRLKGFSPHLRLCADYDFWVRAILTDVPFRHYSYEVAAFRVAEGQLSADQAAMGAERARINAALPSTSDTTLWRRYVTLRFRLRNLLRYLGRARAVGIVKSSRMFAESSSRRA